jgi:hypothetical protein
VSRCVDSYASLTPITAEIIGVGRRGSERKGQEKNRLAREDESKIGEREMLYIASTTEDSRRKDCYF